VRTTPDRGHLPLAVDSNGELHGTDAIEWVSAALAAPLRCADWGAALEAMPARPAATGASIVQVAAHYRSLPGRRAALVASFSLRSLHAENCQRVMGGELCIVRYRLDLG
jgi:hypothetical protein